MTYAERSHGGSAKQSVAFSRNGNVLASGARDNPIVLWLPS
jgi:hypothetical protein